MEAKELRIGNIFNPISGDYQFNEPLTDVFCKVETIGRISCNATLIDDKSENETKPLDFLLTNMAPALLNEEWLIKFGFTLVDYHITVPYYNKSTAMDIGIEVAKNNMQVTITNDSNDTVMPLQIKYIHQLQNLYFALSGEELTLTQ